MFKEFKLELEDPNNLPAIENIMLYKNISPLKCYNPQYDPVGTRLRRFPKRIILVRHGNLNFKLFYKTITEKKN